MSRTEKKILLFFSERNRFNCLSLLTKHLRTTEDRDWQKEILNVTSKVCSIETDAMFTNYVRRLKEEIS